MNKKFALTAILTFIPIISLAQISQKDIDATLRLENELCGLIAKQAVLVANGAAKGLSYEDAVKNSGPSMVRQATPVLQAAYHGMAGAPDIDVRMQSYKICSENAKKKWNQ